MLTNYIQKTYNEMHVEKARIYEVKNTGDKL